MKKTQDTANQEGLSCGNSCTTTCLASVVVGVLLVNAGLTWLIAQNAANQTFSKYMDLEYSKVGGKQNYDDLNMLQRKQIDPYLEQQRLQNPDMFKDDTATGSAQTTQTNDSDGLTLKDITDEKLATILKDMPIKGNKDAEILLIEYSDVDCPFCQRQFKDGTIATVAEAYGDKVGVIFKTTPMAHYDTALVKSEAAYCAKEFAGEKVYMSFIDKAFEHGIKIQDPTSESKEERIKALVDAGVALGAKKADMEKCIADGKYKKSVDDIVAEANSFGITGTPSTLVVNTKTKKTVVVGGAYPLDTYKKAVDKLLK